MCGVMTTEGFVSKNGAEGQYHQGTAQSIEGGCPKKVHRVPLFSISEFKDACNKTYLS
jgi:hypothetical protein